MAVVVVVVTVAVVVTGGIVAGGVVAGGVVTVVAGTSALPAAAKPMPTPAPITAAATRNLVLPRLPARPRVRPCPATTPSPVRERCGETGPAKARVDERTSAVAIVATHNLPNAFINFFHIKGADITDNTPRFQPPPLPQTVSAHRPANQALKVTRHGWATDYSRSLKALFSARNSMILWRFSPAPKTSWPPALSPRTIDRDLGRSPK